MRNGDDLHKLIHSLSKAEKRYFKIKVQQPLGKDASNYLLLFDAIEKQGSYNEAKLSKKLHKYAFSKQLAKTKYLLYELILKTIQQMYMGRNIRSEIHLILESVNILYFKTLFFQSSVLLKKARKLALKYELFNDLLTIIDWEKTLFPYLNKKENILSEKVKEYNLIVEKVTVEKHCKKIYENMQLWYDNFVDLGNNSNITVVLKEIQQESLKMQVKTDTFLSQLYYYKTCTLLALSENNFIGALPSFLVIRTLWKQCPQMIEIHEKEYIHSVISFYLYSLNAKRKEVDYGVLLDNLRVLKSSTQQEAIKASFLFSLLDFMYCLTFELEERSKICFFNLSESFKSHTLLNNNWKITLYYHLGIYHYLNNEYADVLPWLDLIENNTYSPPNLLGQPKLVQLMRQVASADLPHLSDAANRKEIQKICAAFSKEWRLTAIEERVLSHTKRLLNTNYTKNRKDVFANLFHSLQLLDDTNYQLFNSWSFSIKQLNKSIDVDKEIVH